MKAIALTYLRNGLSVVPAIKAQKCPTIKWQKYQKRLPTESEWKNWYTDDALFIICGAVSGSLLVFDFDQQGKVYEDFKAKVPAELFDRLVVETSQSGGKHVIVRLDCPIGKGNKIAIDENKNVLIETRGEGQGFICAPTPGYELIQGDFHNIPILQEHEVSLLWNIAATFNYESTSPLPKNHPVPAQTIGTRPGDDFNIRGSDIVRKILQKHGWKYVGQRGNNDEKWQRPGTNDGHSAYLHITPPVFYPFSTNSHPFESDKTYSYFAVYATLEHGGDFAAATKELASLGYGDALTAEPVELNEFITGTSGDYQKVLAEEAEPRSCYDDDDCPEKFPEHLLNVPGFIGELSQFINETSNAEQPVFSLAASIAFQSLLCAHNIKDPTNIRTNPYILSVGYTSCGKNRGRVVIREIMKRLKDIPAIKDWYDPTHYVTNRIASAEGIGTWLGVNNGILMWLWDEIGRALDTPEHKRPAHINAMITTMMILYTSANDEYDPNLRADVKNTKPTIEQPNFILYGTSTKEKMFEGFSTGNLEDGLIGRLLIFEGNDDWEDIEQEYVQPVPESLVEQAHWWFCQRANRINPLTPAPKTVDVTSEAKVLFRQLADTKRQIRKSKNTIKNALWGRVVEQARQLALAYAASADHENPIVNKDAAQWACDLIAYLTQRKYFLANRHIAGSEFDKNQKAVLRFIEEQKNGRCSRRDISRHFRKFKQWERNEIIDNLLETEAVKIEYQQAEGERQKKELLVINKKINTTTKPK